MKPWLLALLLLQMAPANEPPIARPDAMRYERAIHLPPGVGQACAVLDATIYNHAAPSLADLRIFPAQSGVATAHEVPYAVTLSESVTEETQPARLLNLGASNGKIEFDLEMPARAYTDVALDLDPAIQDFLATAAVTGSDALRSSQSTALGEFTLFDLTSQHLSRDTTLPLAESTFRYLHVVMSVAGAPGAAAASPSRFAPSMVEGAEVPPSREAQILYTPVAETSTIATVGRESRATFQLPLRVPVERISVALAPGYKGNFSREARLTALSEAKDDVYGDVRAPLPESVSGTIVRVHATEAGHEIRRDELSFPAILGANLQSAAKVEVAIENGDDQPLPIAAIRLEMRQRELCFDAAAAGAGPLALYYGDAKLAGPVYDYERLFVSSDKPLAAQLGPELNNPLYRAPAESPRPFTERHPELLWIALLAVICALGTVAIRSAKNVGR
jgi:hypothetical protein